MINYSNLLSLNVAQLHGHLRAIYLDNLDEFKTIIELAQHNERYQLDYLFKIIIDAHQIAYYLVTGESEKYIDTIDKLLWQFEHAEHANKLAGIYHIFANAFSMIDKFDKSIACYMEVIRIEKQNTKSLVAAIAHHNIGQI